MTTTYQTSIVAGVFRDSEQAKRAVEALRGVGFAYDQVGVAMQGAPNATANLHDDLMRLGVGEERSSYYDNEYRAGRIIVSVRPDGRDEQVSDILKQYGAYDSSVNARPVNDEQASNNQPSMRS